MSNNPTFSTDATDHFSMWCGGCGGSMKVTSVTTERFECRDGRMDRVTYINAQCFHCGYPGGRKIYWDNLRKKRKPRRDPNCFAE